MKTGKKTPVVCAQNCSFSEEMSLQLSLKVCIFLRLVLSIMHYIVPWNEILAPTLEIRCVCINVAVKKTFCLGTEVLC